MKLRVLVVLLLALPLFVSVAPRQATAASLKVTAATAGSKRVGETTSAWGRVSTNYADLWIEVETSPGRWSPSQVGWIKADGTYAVKLTYGAGTPGTYRFRVAAESWETAEVAYSPIVTLTRTPWHVSSVGTKPVGQDTYVWGSVPGDNSYASVWTEVQIGGRWSRSQWDIADRFSFALLLTYGRDRAGTYTYRVGADTYDTVLYSTPFTLRRTAHVSASSAGTKRVGETTSTWGTIHGVPNGQAWTEVLIGGRWLRSQLVTTDSNGRFVIPLTYGRTSVGSQTFRVAGTSPFGNVYSPSFSLNRTR